MYLSQKEKKRHPEYEQYIALFEETITQMESGARGRGAPEAIIERCLDKALEFYDADSAALVETNPDLGYGVCVSEHCKTGIRSFEGRIIGVTPEETPYLYEKVMALEVFDVHVQEERGQLSNNEYSMLTRMGVEVFAVAPYLKRYSGYVYIRNPRRFVGLYGFLQAVSYVCASERNEYKLMDNLNVAVSSKECRSEQEVRIKVFGGLSITTKFGSLDESQISSAQAVRLVAYLLMNDTRKVPQNELTNALWSNSEVDAPAKQARNVVHRTRAILEPIFPDELVSSDRAGNYFINPNITVITDASVFESFCRLAQQPAATFKEKLVYLKRATDIYTQW